MGRKELVGRCTAAIAQHGQKSPFGVELGRIAEVQHDVAGNAVNPHAGPARTLVVHRVRDSAQKRNHPQFLEEHGIERDLIETIENVARGAGRAGALDGIDLHEAHSRTSGVMVGFPA